MQLLDQIHNPSSNIVNTEAFNLKFHCFPVMYTISNNYQIPTKYRAANVAVLNYNVFVLVRLQDISHEVIKVLSNVIFLVCLCSVSSELLQTFKPVSAHKLLCLLLLAGSGQADLCRLFLMVHESCREHGATPSQYMAFLHVYTALYNRKQSQLTTRQQHLQVKHVH